MDITCTFSNLVPRAFFPSNVRRAPPGDEVTESVLSSFSSDLLIKLDPLQFASRYIEKLLTLSQWAHAFVHPRNCLSLRGSGGELERTKTRSIFFLRSFGRPKYLWSGNMLNYVIRALTLIGLLVALQNSQLWIRFIWRKLLRSYKPSDVTTAVKPDCIMSKFKAVICNPLSSKIVLSFFTRDFLQQPTMYSGEKGNQGQVAFEASDISDICQNKSKRVVNWWLRENVTSPVSSANPRQFFASGTKNARQYEIASRQQNGDNKTHIDSAGHGERLNFSKIIFHPYEFYHELNLFSV